MKRLLTALFGVALLIPVVAQAQVYVRGHYRSDGTYVQPHYRSSPNNTTADNYSTRGNVNPYTGQPGYRDAYQQPQSRYGTQSRSRTCSYAYRTRPC